MDKSMSVPELLQEITKAKTREELHLLIDSIMCLNDAILKKILLSMIIDKAFYYGFKTQNNKAKEVSNG